jgi:outer membrane protein assembly factor BamB
VRRWLLIAGAVLVVAILAAGVGYVLYVRHLGRDIRGSSTVQFNPTEVPPAPKPKPAQRRAELGIPWPEYGHDQERLRVATGVSLAPPFRRAWLFRARRLVEFPPAIAYGRLYFANNDGVLFAVDADTGRLAWRYVSNRCQAMSPAVDRDIVFATFLNPPPCNSSGDGETGQLLALSAATGRVLWRRTIGPSESSPVVSNGSVYVGDWDGRVYSFSERTGNRSWTFQAGGKVKGGVAVSGNHVFVGDYDSHVYSLDARTGKLEWTASAQPRLGHPGEFYATPAVAYGRVFIGSTDGKEYAFGAGTGDLLWSHSTGGYVYSSSAVWRKRIFAGSYSGTFYCFDAATGDTMWSFQANGPISGSPTIVAGRVYFATLARRTYALNAATGKVLWTFPDGKYSPVVADTQRLYLVGFTKLYGLEEPKR